MFPFSIKYSARLKRPVNNADSYKALQYIKAFIADKTGEDIQVKDNELTFKSGFFRMRWRANIMATIEKGTFHIVNTGYGSVLVYEIYMYRLLTVTFCLAVFMALVSSHVWIGIACFAWIGGLNWITAVIRHRSMLHDIADGVDAAIDAPAMFAGPVFVENSFTANYQQNASAPGKFQVILFYIAAICWLVSLTTNIACIAGFDVAQRFTFIWLLHIGIFAVLVPAIITLKKSPVLQDKFIKQYPAKTLSALVKRVPRWLTAIAIAGFIYAFINFALFATSQPGSPQFQNGQYVLQNHGLAVKTITEQEYHYYRANEIRGFSGHWIAFYGISLLLLYPGKPVIPNNE